MKKNNAGEIFSNKLTNNKINPKQPKENKKTCFTLSLSDEQASTLQEICIARGMEPYDVNYASYAYKSNGFNLVMYQSGKLVIQGKEAEDFVLYTVEPQVTLQFTHGNEEFLHPEWFTPHAGLDESGKGDFFGAVVTACVIAGGEQVSELRKVGVKDSKLITSDAAVFEIEKRIRGIKNIAIDVMQLSMVSYNSLYARFGSNLNRLLGWMHSCSLKNALRKKYVQRGLLDQFSKQPITQGFIKKDFPEFVLDMQTKAESDPVVAAASIIARATYLRQIEELSKKAKRPLPKGASKHVKEIGKAIFEQMGAEGLAMFCKTHFKTFAEITGRGLGEEIASEVDPENLQIE